MPHERDRRPDVLLLGAHFHLEEPYALARVGTHRFALLELFPRGDVVFVLAGIQVLKMGNKIGVKLACHVLVVVAIYFHVDDHRLGDVGVDLQQRSGRLKVFVAAGGGRFLLELERYVACVEAFVLPFLELLAAALEVVLGGGRLEQLLQHLGALDV